MTIKISKMSEFEGAGQSEGLQIWRIEDFKCVPWTKHGTFHTGDSYVILKVRSINEVQTKKIYTSSKSNQISCDIKL